MNTIQSNPTGKWTPLILGSITLSVIVSMPFLCMSVLFKEIADDLRLNLVEIGFIWGIMPFAGILIGLPGGLLVDRFGIKNSLVAGCIMAGIFGAMRGLSCNLTALIITTFLYSLLNAAVPTAVFKIASIFFSGRQRSMAQGIVTAGMGVGALIGGFASASIVSPLVGGWRNVMFLYGGLGILVGLVWIFIRIPMPARGTEKTISNSPASFLALSKRVLGMRDVWLLSIVLLGYNACFQGLLGYTPLFLRNSGWTPYAADLAFALIPIASILATLPITFLSDRFGARRSILVVILFVCMVSTGLMAIMQGPVIWLLCILIGLGRDSFTAISMAMNYEIEEVGADTTAAAMGLVNSVSRIGAVIAPPLGNSLVAIDPGFPFITWAAFILPSFVIFFMHKGNIHAK